MSDELTNDDLKQAIIDLRGGLPAACDFCRKETAPENLEPEEAGEWVCHECLDRWNKQNNEPKP